MYNVFEAVGDQCPSAAFCVKALDDKQRELIYDTAKEINKELQSFSKVLQKLAMLSFLFGLLLILVSTLAAIGLGALWLQITLRLVGILFLCMSLAITVWGLIRQSKYSKSEKHTRTIQQHEEALLRNLHALGIPEEYVSMDVMLRAYNGENALPFSENQYLLTAFCAYCDKENFYLAEVDRVFAFPRRELVACKRIKKEVMLLGWNKPIEPGEGQLPYVAAYRAKKGNIGGGYPLFEYLSLQLLHGGERYEILFPAYEEKRLYALLDIC